LNGIDLKPSGAYAEVLKRAAEHVGATHNMKTIPPDVLAKVRAAVRDE
jgi:predicted small metal-binding protein